MRLSCPNCDAQYEVADDAVPQAGRDVQCSNCGHAWFQLPAGAESGSPLGTTLAAGDLLTEAEATDSPDLSPGLAASRFGDGRGSRERDNEDDDENDEDAVSDAGSSAFDQPPPLKPREVDEGVLAVLRDEAERETAARRRDAEAAVAQGKARADRATSAPVAATDVAPAPDDRVRDGEIGMTSTPPPAMPVVRELPAMREDQAADFFADPTAASRPGKGRELLPDIDAIKSTLQASTDRPDADLLAETYEPARRGSGFRAGFLLTVTAGILLAFLYVTAPGIAARFPMTAPTLGAYVAGVDDARLWLDELARRAGDSLTAQGSGTGTD